MQVAAKDTEIKTRGDGQRVLRNRLEAQLQDAEFERDCTKSELKTVKAELDTHKVKIGRLEASQGRTAELEAQTQAQGDLEKQLVSTLEASVATEAQLRAELRDVSTELSQSKHEYSELSLSLVAKQAELDSWIKRSCINADRSAVEQARAEEAEARLKTASEENECAAEKMAIISAIKTETQSMVKMLQADLDQERKLTKKLTEERNAAQKSALAAEVTATNDPKAAFGPLSPEPLMQLLEKALDQRDAAERRAREHDVVIAGLNRERDSLAAALKAAEENSSALQYGYESATSKMDDYTSALEHKIKFLAKRCRDLQIKSAEVIAKCTTQDLLVTELLEELEKQRQRQAGDNKEMAINAMRAKQQERDTMVELATRLSAQATQNGQHTDEIVVLTLPEGWSEGWWPIQKCTCLS